MKNVIISLKSRFSLEDYYKNLRVGTKNLSNISASVMHGILINNNNHNNNFKVLKYRGNV